MNKQRTLKQRLIKRVIICVIMLAASGGLYFATASILGQSKTKKDQSEAALLKDRAEISSLRTQLDKSGAAESRFLEIKETRKNTDFLSDNDALMTFLRNAKDRYRLSSNFKLTLATEKLAPNHHLGPSNYEIYEHPGMRLEFSAMSDTHIFSFLDDFTSNAPGIIKVESISLSRLGDVDASMIEQIGKGATPYTVSAFIGFNWIGLKEKQLPKTGGTP